LIQVFTTQFFILNILGVVAGSVVPRLVAQWLLRSRNSGVVWYVSQIVLGVAVAVASSFVGFFVSGFGLGFLNGVFGQMVYQAMCSITALLHLRRVTRSFRQYDT
jgi:hypothetical protein